MEQRITYDKAENALKPLNLIGAYLRKSPIERNLIELIYVRVSQINGCAFCVDMHYKEARAKGESEQRLYGLITWRATTYYSDREKAALALAEAVTGCNVPDTVYNEVKKYFSDEEIIDLTLAVTTINTWNRINTTFVKPAGAYQLGQFE
jgi:AhpD family alkylhydroperoxidase